MERQAAREAEAEAKTAKNRAKRQKRKIARRGGARESEDPVRRDGATTDAPTISKLAAAGPSISERVSVPEASLEEPGAKRDSSQSGTLPVARGVEIKVLDDD